MSTEFIHLNKNWNAEPNAPQVNVEIQDEFLSLSFLVNPLAYEGFEEGQKSELHFFGCSTWRLGPTNDEGWYSGICRFSNVAPLGVSSMKSVVIYLRIRLHMNGIIYITEREIGTSFLF